MKVSAIFLIFFLFSALLSARRCSPVGDVIVKRGERRGWFVIAWIEGYFSLFLLVFFFFLLQIYFPGKQRGGWNKRRNWWFGEPNQATEQRILPNYQAASFIQRDRETGGGGAEGGEKTGGWMKMGVYAVA